MVKDHPGQLLRRSKLLLFIYCFLGTNVGDAAKLECHHNYQTSLNVTEQTLTCSVVWGEGPTSRHGKVASPEWWGPREGSSAEWLLPGNMDPAQCTEERPGAVVRTLYSFAH